MSGWFLAMVFLVSLAAVLYGWWQLLKLSFRLEKQRFGWSDEEALQNFVALRRPRGRGSKRRISRYLRGDLRDYAEATDQGKTHRRARLALAAGYAGALASAIAWVAAQAFALRG